MDFYSASSEEQSFPSVVVVDLMEVGTCFVIVFTHHLYLCQNSLTSPVSSLVTRLIGQAALYGMAGYLRCLVT